MIDIETAKTDNPQRFWEYIRKLGPKKCNDIPHEVYDNVTGLLRSDDNYVLHKWKCDFENLLNVPDENQCDDLLNARNFLELQMLDPLYESNRLLNKDISVEEVRNVIMKLKAKKACGIDEVYNEVLKNEPVIKLLKELFQICFDSALIPSMWLKAIIHPIPKAKGKDKRIPLNYRGISLLCTISKVFYKHYKL